MKIAFFTEGQYQGKIPRELAIMRTEMAWMCASNADHYNINSFNTSEEYDLGVCIIPKKDPDFDLANVKKHCKQVASMQEGPHWYFQDYSLEKQIWFYNTLQEMDFLFVHSELAKQYFLGLTNKRCMVMQSLMIEDNIKDLPTVDRKSVMIGGNFCSWYGGFDSYIVAQEFDCNITAPTMGRIAKGEDQMPDIEHLPYMEWKTWIEKLNESKYGVHLMKTHAAGTFALNCAYLGIPCIGYAGLDTQIICHPLTTVKLGDLQHARELAQKLKEDDKFYNLCSNTAKETYNKFYTEKKWLKRFKEWSK